jgi:hypothetical protein
MGSVVNRVTGPGSWDAQMPAATCLELARKLEAQENFERSALEYERLAVAFPKQKESLLVLYWPPEDSA